MSGQFELAAGRGEVRTRAGLFVAVSILTSCSNAAFTSPTQHHFKVTENGGAYLSDVSRYESLGQKSLKRGQKYRITEVGEHSTGPFYIVANISQYVGGKKGDANDGVILFVQDGSAEYDCMKWMTDRKLSESDEDTPEVTCKFQLVGVVPIPEMAILQNDTAPQ